MDLIEITYSTGAQIVKHLPCKREDEVSPSGTQCLRALAENRDWVSRTMLCSSQLAFMDTIQGHTRK